jgi:RimJ/RimL family protein N-acetyltransferase
VAPFDVSDFEAPLAVPELRHGPVMLRPFALSDLPLLREAATDPYIADITSVPRVYGDDVGRAFIARQHERAFGGHGYPFVISEATDPDRGVGALGVWLREIESGRASLGYWLVPSARGRKLAGWALRAAVDFCFSELSIPRLHLFVEPWNTASQRTAEFAGFTREALLRGWERIGDEQHDAYSYALLREEWLPGPGSPKG